VCYVIDVTSYGTDIVFKQKLTTKCTYNFNTVTEQTLSHANFVGE